MIVLWAMFAAGVIVYLAWWLWLALYQRNALLRFYRAWSGWALMDHVEGCDGPGETEGEAARRARLVMLDADRELHEELGWR